MALTFGEDVRESMTRHGNMILGEVAIYAGLGMAPADALEHVTVGGEYDEGEDLACVVAALLGGMADSSGLLDAICRATADYFEGDDRLHARPLPG